VASIDKANGAAILFALPINAVTLLAIAALPMVC
jgi:hypothetical protein